MQINIFFICILHNVENGFLFIILFELFEVLKFILV